MRAGCVLLLRLPAHSSSTQQSTGHHRWAPALAGIDSSPLSSGQCQGGRTAENAKAPCGEAGPEEAANAAAFTSPRATTALPCTMQRPARLSEERSRSRDLAGSPQRSQTAPCRHNGCAALGRSRLGRRLPPKPRPGLRGARRGRTRLRGRAGEAAEGPAPLCFAPSGDSPIPANHNARGRGQEGEPANRCS